MATTKLVIRSDKINKTGETPIYIQYCHNQKTTLISTGEKIQPNLWDSNLLQAKREDIIRLEADGSSTTASGSTKAVSG